MSERLILQDLVDLLANEKGLTKKDAEAFLRELLSLIAETIETADSVKIKDFGTFKLVKVNSRKSVDVNTGAEIEIPSHYKLSFTPDKLLKERVNIPFAHFESVVLEDGVSFEDTKESVVITENVNDEKAEFQAETAEPSDIDEAMDDDSSDENSSVAKGIVESGMLNKLADEQQLNSEKNNNETNLHNNIEIESADKIISNSTNDAEIAIEQESSQAINADNTETNIINEPVQKDDTSTKADEASADEPLVTINATVESAQTSEPITKTTIETTQSPEVVTKTSVETTQSDEVAAKTAVETTQSPEVITKTTVDTTQSPEVAAKTTVVTTQSDEVAAKTAVETTQSPEVITKTTVDNTQSPEVVTKTTVETTQPDEENDKTSIIVEKTTISENIATEIKRDNDNTNDASFKNTNENRSATKLTIDDSLISKPDPETQPQSISTISQPPVSHQEKEDEYNDSWDEEYNSRKRNIIIGAAFVALIVIAILVYRFQFSKPSESVNIANTPIEATTEGPEKVADNNKDETPLVTDSLKVTDQPEEQSEIASQGKSDDDSVKTTIDNSANDKPIIVTISRGVTMRSLGEKYYGLRPFWVYIYEENKDKIPNPNNVTSGTKIVIPAASKYGINKYDPESVEKAKKLEAKYFSKF